MKKIKSLFTIMLYGTLTFSTILLTSIPIFKNSKISSISYENQNSLETQNISQDELEGVSFANDDIYSKNSTPYGYLKYDSIQKEIKMISFFGHSSWTYNLSSSNFIKRIGNYSSITTLHTLYISDIDRIVVYGTVDSTKSFMFQLYASDGTEYYVNPDNPIPSASSVVYGDKNCIDSLNIVSYMNDGTVVLLPKTWNSSKQINTYRINLNSYISSSLNFDFTIANLDNNTYTFDEVIGVTLINPTQRVVLVKAIKTVTSSSNNSTTYQAGVMAFCFSPNMSSISTSFQNFTEVSGNSVNDIFPKCIYKFQFWKKSSTTFQIYVIMQKSPDTNNVIGVSNSVVVFYPGTNYSVASKNVKMVDVVSSNVWQDFIMWDIIFNKKNNKLYFFGINKETKKIGIESKDLSNYTYSREINANFDISNFVTQNNLEFGKFNFFIKIVHEDSIINSSNSSLKYPGIFTIEKYDDTKTNITQKIVQSFEITGTGITFTNNFTPTKIHTSSNITSDYSHYLPQDINTSILSSYYYLYNSSNVSEKLYGSKISINSSSPLIIDNNKGTLKGTIYLNLNKWWLSPTDANYVMQYPIQISISGLSTNSGLFFNIVTSPEQDSDKYNKILEIQKIKYPSEVSKQDILDNFIVKGNNVVISADNIVLKKDGQIVEDTANNKSAVVIVDADDTNGILDITYDISSIVSPSVTNKTGNATFYNFKQLNTWQQIRLNSEKWTNIRKTKMPFQVTKQDIINCLELSQSYSRDPNLWEWNTTVSESTNKQAFIEQNINGTLSGTISYNRESGNTPESIPMEATRLTINESNDGNNFLTIQSSMGSNNENSIFFNNSRANQIASSYSLEDAKNKAYDIFKETLVFYNNWTTIDSLVFGNPFVSNQMLSYNLKFNSNIVTNFLKPDGSKLILDNDWIDSINKVSSVLQIDRTFSFQYNQTIYKWNYDIPSSTSTHSIKNMIDSQNSFLAPNILKELSELKPSLFVKKYYNEENQNFLKFQDEFQLLHINSSSNHNDISYFEIKDLQLVADDELGTVYVQYTINYPNIGNIATGGETIFPQITITGFPTIASESQKWIITAIALSSLTIATGICFSIYAIVNRVKTIKNRTKYGIISSDGNINLNEKKFHNFHSIFKKQKTSTRNTINRDVLNNRKSKNFDSRIKSYTKLMNEIKKSRYKKDE